MFRTASQIAPSLGTSFKRSSVPSAATITGTALGVRALKRDYFVFVKHTFPPKDSSVGKEVLVQRGKQKFDPTASFEKLRAQPPHANSTNHSLQESYGGRPVKDQKFTTVEDWVIYGSSGPFVVKETKAVTGKMRVDGDKVRDTPEKIADFFKERGTLMHFGKMSDEGYAARTAFAEKWVKDNPKYDMQAGPHCMTYVRDEICYLVDQGHLAIPADKEKQLEAFRGSDFSSITGGKYAETIADLELHVPGGGSRAELPGALQGFKDKVMTPDSILEHGLEAEKQKKIAGDI